MGEKTMRPSLKSQTILVTGGAGFIGSHLVDRLQSQFGCKVIIVDNLFVGSEDNIKDAIERGAVFYKEDAEFMSSLEYIFSEYDIQTVFNCATKALNYSFLNPQNAYSTNVTVALNLLELQRGGQFKTLCHFSTSEVYGTAKYEPMDESHPRNPTTTYAAGKAAADLAVESYVRMFDVDAFIVRPFNNYGPRQNFKGDLAGVIPITVAKIMQGLKPEIHGSGEQSRDFIYVTDTVDAVVKLYEKLPSGDNVNISSDNVTSISSLVSALCEELGYEGGIVRKEGRKSDVFCHNASNSKVKEIIEYELTGLKEGLKATVDWYKNNIPLKKQ